LSSFGLVFIGLLAGVIASASGLGGGIAIIPILNRVFGVNIKKASVISLGVITVSSLSMSFVNSTVNLHLAAWNIGLLLPAVFVTLSLAVVLTAPLGVSWAHKLSNKSISYIYAVILAVVITIKGATLFQLLYS
jgi:uncharacterized protein